jgi:ABC-type multidrug transport system ATPase subunit
LINIEHISKFYDKGKVEALHDVSLKIKTGELFGLLGPDGAGKTSLIRIITSLILPDKGSITVFDYDVVRDYKMIRKIIGYMPGRFSLYQDLSVEENLNFFAKVFQSDIQSNYHLIKELYDQLSPFKDRRAGKLSGGMKQKLALCCALIHEPRLLLLDEPTTGVDPVSRKEFWDMLIRLKAKGITIIVSTPYMDEASLCDRVALMQMGNILETGVPEEICSESKLNLYSVTGSDMYALMKCIRSFPDTVSCYAFGDSHHVELRSLDANSLMKYLNQNGIQDAEIIKIKAGIEDVFMAKTDTLQ